MKRIFALLLFLPLLLFLAACGNQEKNTISGRIPPMSQSTSPTVHPGPAESTPSPEQTEPSASSDTLDDMRADFQEAMAQYEALYEEYNRFMEEFQKNPMDAELRAQYADMISALSKMSEVLNASLPIWEDDDRMDKEMEDNFDAAQRIIQKLLEAAQSYTVNPSN